MPHNEYDRILELSDYGLNYAELQEELVGLTQLVAKIANTKISAINLIDHYTQWTVARTGTEMSQMPRDQSVCQHTIMGNQPFEIESLSEDERTKNQPYVLGRGGLNYYYGLPLKTSKGLNLGALCVMDMEKRELSEDAVEQIALIANEVIARLELIREMNRLRVDLRDKNEKQRKISHDIRGPIGGIIGLAEIVSSQIEAQGNSELAEMMMMIKDSGESVIDLADGILRDHSPELDEESLVGDDCTLQVLADSLHDLYTPQAKSKGVAFIVDVEDTSRVLPMAKHQLMQICGNLVSNAIKFTPENGKVSVILGFISRDKGRSLRIRVADTGVGMSEEALDSLRRMTAQSRPGTAGETGYGLGIPLVQHLVSKMDGELRIESGPGAGCVADVELPA